MGKCDKCPKVCHDELVCKRGKCVCVKEENCRPKKYKKVKKCYKCEIPCSENEKVKMLEVHTTCCDGYAFKCCGLAYIPTTFDTMKMARKCYRPERTDTKYCCDFRHDVKPCHCEESECPVMEKVVSCERPRCCRKKQKKEKCCCRRDYRCGSCSCCR